RVVRNLTEAGRSRAIQGLLDPAGGRRGAFGWRSAAHRPDLGGRSPRLRELGRFVGRSGAPTAPQATATAASVAAAAAATDAAPTSPAVAPAGDRTARSADTGTPPVT